MAKATKRKPLDAQAQFLKDAERAKQLASAMCCAGVHAEPADLLELLLIFKKYSEQEQDDLILYIAMHTFVSTVEGDAAVSLFIR